MKNDVLIKVENVSKKFSRDLKKSLWYGIKDIGGDLIGSSNNNVKLRKKEFWALENISFELKRGEVLGLIGRNGAGKTTLLKLLNGLTKPDSGKITMRGRVGALIALGAGFNPILTGRENVYVNGAVLGLSKKEIDENFDEIVGFAELWDFIDTPVQNYSSGMHVRLGFAIASFLSPDVLILDEVLAVGDLRFRNKCYNRIGKIVQNSTVVLVSHDLNAIQRLCDRVLYLKNGKIIINANKIDAMNAYTKEAYDNQNKKSSGFISSYLSELNINKIYLKNYKIISGESLVIYIDYKTDAIIEIGHISCTIKNVNNELIAHYRSDISNRIYSFYLGENTMEIPINNINISGGKYTLTLSAFNKSGKINLFSAGDILTFEVENKFLTTAMVQLT